MTNLIGKSLGRYHIIEQLGEGGMAIVYKAYDTRLETDVAVKVIRTENLAPAILENALVRFEREAKALAKLTHSNIVKVQDYGQFEEMPWLVMPYLPGGTLKEKLRGKAMPYQQAAGILVPIARALAYAHQQGMVHRDVKPSNILITQAGDPMLTDFGIAKIIDTDATFELTGTGVTIGTPEYMAPEQATSKKIDHRADIYSLGIVFFEMVAGSKPYQADTPMAVLIKHVNEPLPRPKKFVPDLPDQVERVLLKSLAKNPDDRYATMTEFAAALERLAHGDVSSTTEIGARGTRQPDPTLMAGTRTTVQADAPRWESQPIAPAKKSTNWMAIGMGGIGIVFAGICVVALAILWIVNSNNAANQPTTVYEPPTARPAEATSRPVQVQPTSAPPLQVFPTDTLAPIKQPTATPSCPRAKYPTRLRVDADARVCTKNERLIIRKTASMNGEERFSIYTGTTIRIVEGPVCADDFWWWKVEVYPGTPYGKQGRGFNPIGTTAQSVLGWAREGWDDTDAYYICQ